MPRYRHSPEKAQVLFSCAQDFANSPAKIDQVVGIVSAPGFSPPNSKRTKGVRAGIVMAVYPETLAAVYALIRTLSEVMHGQLPTEI